MKASRQIRRLFSRIFILLLFGFGIGLQITGHSNQTQDYQTEPSTKTNLLSLLKIEPSPSSMDFVFNKIQFHMQNLITEQRHPVTMKLSERIKKDLPAGLNMLFSVDEDIKTRLSSLANNTAKLEQVANAMEKALLSNNKIKLYGCGTGGRAAKMIEGGFWHPFWEKVKKDKKIWKKLSKHLPENIEDFLSGEMTGNDTALITPMDGLEDLMLVGHLQYEKSDIDPGDMVICISGGDAASSVTGYILAAVDHWKEAKKYDPAETRKFLYFFHSNPNDQLLPLERSKLILREPGITKIDLTTGPQSITGATNMQAATIETYVLGIILETAIDRLLRKHLSGKEMSRLGFHEPAQITEKLQNFSQILEQIKKNLPVLAELAQLEAQTFHTGHYATYYAKKGLLTTFIDSTDRSTYFHLAPLDTIKENKRNSWIQIWTSAETPHAAWKALLGRPFQSFPPEIYKDAIENVIVDPYLKNTIFNDLKQAEKIQPDLYDFTFSHFNIINRSPKAKDLGLLIVLSPEEDELTNKNSEFIRFLKFFQENGANTAIIILTDKTIKDMEKIREKIPDLPAKTYMVQIHFDNETDPLGVNHQIALKVLLNAHSTAVMAKLGRIIGNSMTHVNPGNLRLISRATFLIQTLINDMFRNPQWVKYNRVRNPISFGEANAVLFDSIRYHNEKGAQIGQISEVALSIIRILESLRLNQDVPLGEVLKIVKEKGLSSYLAELASRSD